MEQYIPKSALVAEIERRRESNAKERYFGRLVEDNYFLDFIDTLEVIEIGIDVGSPEGDLETVQLIDADGYVKEICKHRKEKRYEEMVL